MINKANQQGITLLISILVLSALALIASTVGFFALQEIRASRAVFLTEPAISAAYSGGEQGMWAIKRDTALNTCPTISTTTLGNNSKIDLCKSFGPAVISITGGVDYNVYLFNPDDINGDIDLSEYPYTYLQATNQSGLYSVTITVTRLNGNAVGEFSVAPGATGTLNLPAVASGTEGRMKITLRSASDALVELNTNRGMPEFPTVDASGCTAIGSIPNCNSPQEIFKRRLNITVPK